MSKLLNPEEMTSRITTLTPTPTLGSTQVRRPELVAKRGELGPAATARSLGQHPACSSLLSLREAPEAQGQGPVSIRGLPGKRSGPGLEPVSKGKHVSGWLSVGEEETLLGVLVLWSILASF